MSFIIISVLKVDILTCGKYIFYFTFTLSLEKYEFSKRIILSLYCHLMHIKYGIIYLSFSYRILFKNTTGTVTKILFGMTKCKFDNK